MKMRRMITLLLVLAFAIVMSLTIIPQTVSATSNLASGTITDTLSWSITSSYTLNITGSGDMPDYFYAPWHDYYNSIKTVNIGADVTSIGDYAFYDCYAVNKVSIGKSVKRIGYNAFAWCKNISSIEIPKSVEVIEHHAFYRCNKLTSIKLNMTTPDGIDGYAFEGLSATITYPTEQYIWNDYICSYGGNNTWVSTAANTGKLNLVAEFDSSSGDIKLSWNTISNATNYTIYRRVATEQEYTLWDVTNEITYLDETDQKGFMHFYYIVANSPEKIYSNGISIMSGYASPLLYIDSDEVTGKPYLFWDKVDGATGYEVHFSIDGSKYSPIKRTGDNYWLDEDVNVGDKYYYKVRVYNGVRSEFSNEVYIMCQCPQPKINNVGNDEASGKPIIYWDAVDGATGYNIYRADSGYDNYELIGDTLSCTFTDTEESLRAGYAYDYSIEAVNKDYGVGSALSEPKTAYPNLEQLKQISISNDTKTGKPYLSWNSVFGAFGYRIYRNDKTTGNYDEIDKVTTKYYTDTDPTLMTGEEYSYKIVACANNEDYNAALSGAVSITCVLSQPANISVDYDEEQGKPILTWDAVQDATNYKIYRSTIKNGTYEEIDYVSKATYTDVSAVTNQKYFYKIQACNSNDSSIDSALTDAIEVTCKYPRPVNLRVVDDAKTGYPVISWDAVEYAKLYSVFVCDSQGNIKDNFISSETSFVYDKAIGGEECYYKVKVFATVLYAGSAFSDEVKHLNICSTPKLTVANEAASGKPKLTWDEVSGATGYRVYRSTQVDSNEFLELSGNTTEGVTDTGFIDDTAVPNNTYYYKVQAYNINVSDADSVLSESESCLCKYAQPTIEVESHTTTGIPTISWETIDGASYYKLYRSQTENGDYSVISAKVLGVSYRDYSATLGQKYYYKVQACSSDNSEADSVVSDSGSCFCRCVQPTINVTNNPVKGKPVITWKAVTGALYYSVYRSETESGEYSQIGEKIIGVKFEDDSAVAGQTYYYKVQSCCGENPDANSALSDSKKSVCKYTQPVIEVTNDETTGKPIISWEAVDGAQAYKIYRSATEVGGYGSPISGVLSDVTTFTDDETEAGQKYYYKVQACYSLSEESKFDSSLSNSKEYIYKCAQPEVTIKIDEDSGKPLLSWNEVKGAQHYLVYYSLSGAANLSLISDEICETQFLHEKARAGTCYYKVVACAEVEDCTSESEVKSVSVVVKEPHILETGNSDISGKPYIKFENDYSAIRYYVMRADSQDGTYTIVSSEYVPSEGNGDYFEFIDNSAIASNEYYYKIQAGGPGYVLFTEVECITCKCAQPVIEVTNDETTGKPIISWEAVDGAQAYKIYRSATEVGGYGSPISGVLSDVTTFTDDETEAGQKYYYKVQACYSLSEESKFDSSLSNSKEYIYKCAQPEVTIKIDEDSGKPLLSWNEVKGAQHYLVYYSLSGAANLSLISDEICETQFLHEKARAGTCYYKVVACAEVEDCTSESEVKSVSVVVKEPHILEIGNSDISGKPYIKFENDYSAIRYYVMRADSQDGTYTIVSSEYVPSEGNGDYFEFIDNSAIVSNEYYYKIQAGGPGYVLFTEVECITCKCVQPVIEVTNDETTGKPIISWEAIDGATGYKVYRLDNADGEYKVIGETSDETTYTDASAKAGQNNSYKVQACITDNDGAASALSNALDCLCKCAQPVIEVTNDATTGKPTVSWTAIDGATGYKIYCLDREDGEYKVIGETSDETTYTDLVAEVGDNNTYKVQACYSENSDVDSILSNSIVCICKLAQPQNFKVENDAKTNKPKLSWDAVAKADTYQYCYSTDGQSFSDPIEVTASEVVHTDAQYGKTYYYKVQAVNDNSLANSEYSQVKSITILDQPQDINAVIDDEEENTTISWDKVEGADYYIVYLSPLEHTAYSEIGRTSTTTYENESRYIGKFYYKVKACSDNNDIPALSESKEVIYKLQKPVISVTGDEITGKPKIEWERNGAASHYYVYKVDETTKEYSILTVMSLNSKSNFYVDTSAKVGEVYEYTIKACYGNNRNIDSDYADLVKCQARYAKPAVTVSTDTKTGKPKISWDRVAQAETYQYCYSTDGKNYSDPIKVTSTEVVHTDAQLGESYYYKVQAINNDYSEINSAYSEVKSIVCKLAQPKVLVSSISTSTGKPWVLCGTVEGATGYSIYRSTSKNGEYECIENNGGVSYTDNSAKVGTTYYYKFEAISEGNEAAASELSLATYGMLTKCAFPKLRVENDMSLGVPQLSWEEVEGATEYEVVRSVSRNGKYVTIGKTNSVTYTDTDATLEVGKAYYYQVKAICASEEYNASSYYSPSKSCVVKLAQPKLQPINAKVSSGKPLLTWDTVNGATGYEVHRRDNTDSDYIRIATTAECIYEDTEAKAGEEYWYRIKAVLTLDGEDIAKAYSDEQSCICRCATPEVTVSQDEATGKPQLSWSEVEGATHYYIYYSNTADGEYEQLSVTGETEYIHGAAEQGETYSYKVVAAVDAQVEQDYDSLVEATVSIDESTSSCSLSWQEDEEATHYYVYYSVDNGETYKVLTVTEETSYVTSKTQADMIYKVEARYSIDTAVCSELSEVVSITI